MRRWWCRQWQLCGRGAHLVHDCLTPSPRYVSLTENSKNNITLRRLEPTSISLKISLELVHLTTTPLIHIFLYRMEINNHGQCSGTYTLGFLASYDQVEFSSLLRWWSPLSFTGTHLRPLLALSSALHRSSSPRCTGALLRPSSALSVALRGRSAGIGKLGEHGYF